MSATDISRILARAREAGVVAGPPGVIASIADLEEAPDRSIITRLGGVPVGFQFGTALGFDGLPAFVLDVLTDPVTYLAGVGAVTKAGRGAQALRRASAATARAERGAAKLATTAEQLARARQLSPQDVFAAQVLGLENAGRVDTSRLQSLRGLLGRSASDAEALERLQRFSDLDRAARFRGLRGRLGSEAPAAAGRRAALTPSARSVSQDEQTARAIKALQSPKESETGIEAALRQVSSEIARREEVIDLARQAKTAPSVEAFEAIASKLKKLDPSARAQLVLSPRNLRDLRIAVNQIHSGTVDISKAGQRAAVSFRTPLGDVNLGSTELVSRIGGIAKKIPGIPDLSRRARVGGLIPRARAGRDARNAALLLEEFQRSNAPEALSESLGFAVNTLRGIGLTDTHYTGINNAWHSEILRSKIGGSKVEQALSATAKKLEWSDDDLFSLVRLVDDPDKFIDTATGTETIFRGAALRPAARELNLTDAHLELAETLSRELERSGAVLKSMGAVENTLTDYFPRLVSFVKKGKEKAFEQAIQTSFNKAFRVGKKTTGVSTFLSHGRPRLVEALDTLRGLEKKGVIELEKNPAVIMRKFFEASGRAAADARMLRRMERATYTPDAVRGVAEGSEALPLIIVPKIGKNGRPVFTDAEKAAVDAGDYTPIVDDRLLKFVSEIGVETQKKSWQNARQAWMPQGAARAIRATIAPSIAQRSGQAIEGLSEKAMRGALELNSFAKRSLLLVSAFHHMALTESAVAVLGGRALTIGPRVLRRVRKQQRDFFEASDVIEFSTRHGLQLGSPIDPQLDDLQRFIKRASDATGGAAGKVLNPFGRFVAWWDRGLWDFYHNGLKLQSFHELFHRSLARPKFRNADPRLVAEGVAEHVNNAFGGQVWGRFWVGRQGQQLSRLFLLAPDWTASNLRIAGDVFMNWFKKHTPGVASVGGRFPITSAELLRADVRATFARQYALRAGFAAFVGWNLANWAATSWNGGSPDLSKGRFLDRNPVGFRSMVDTGFSDTKGRPLFLRPGKQFREPFQFAESTFRGVPGVPIDFFKRKASPTVTLANNFFTGRNIFGEPIVTAEDGPVHRLAQSLKFVSTEFAPIPLQQTVIDGEGSVGAALGAMGLPLKSGELPPGAEEGITKQLSMPAYREELRKAQEEFRKNLAKGLL